MLKGGDKVPADVRVIECSDDMKVDNASPRESLSLSSESPCAQMRIRSRRATCASSAPSSRLELPAASSSTLATTPSWDASPRCRSPPKMSRRPSRRRLITSSSLCWRRRSRRFLLHHRRRPRHRVAHQPRLYDRNHRRQCARGPSCHRHRLLDVTAKRMHGKSVLVKNLEGVETLGSTSASALIRPERSRKTS